MFISSLKLDTTQMDKNQDNRHTEFTQTMGYYHEGSDRA